VVVHHHRLEVEKIEDQIVVLEEVEVEVEAKMEVKVIDRDLVPQVLE
jgi:hypothetical protein